MALDRVFTGPPADGRVDNPDAAAHVRKVLRLRNGDTFAGYDGEQEYELRLLGGSGAGLRVEVVSSRELPLPGREIVLAAALVKGRRWESLLEKAVELGVSAIRPVAVERCVVKIGAKDAEAKTGRWKKVMQAACAQCAGRMPELHLPAALEEVLEKTAGVPERFILSCGDGAKPASALAAGTGPVMIMVGPEGDWTPGEEELAQSVGIVPVTLGTRILRSETAALAALAIASAGAGK